MMKTAIKRTVRWFDKLEDRVRIALSRHPAAYAMIGSVGIILLWRGVWGFADEVGMGHVASIVLGGGILLVTGLFVSFFVGEQIIISGINEEKRTDEQTEEEIRFQSVSRIHMQWKLEGMLKQLDRRIERIERQLGTLPPDYGEPLKKQNETHGEHAHMEHKKQA